MRTGNSFISIATQRRPRPRSSPTGFSANLRRSTETEGGGRGRRTDGTPSTGAARASPRHHRPTPASPVPSGRSPRASTPAARAAAANRSPTICGESGTTWSSGARLAAARRVRMARATPSFTNRTSLVSPFLVGLAAADGDEDPVAVGRVGDIDPARGVVAVERRERPATSPPTGLGNHAADVPCRAPRGPAEARRASAPASSASPAPDGLPAMKCHRSSEKGAAWRTQPGRERRCSNAGAHLGRDTPRGQPWSPPPPRTRKVAARRFRRRGGGRPAAAGGGNPLASGLTEPVGHEAYRRPRSERMILVRPREPRWRPVARLGRGVTLSPCRRFTFSTQSPRRCR